MNNIEQRVEQLREDLDLMEDPTDRLEYFVEKAHATAPLAAELKVDGFKVPGCISQLWIVPSLRGQRCHFLCDGDALIPKGIALAVLELFEGVAPDEIINFDRRLLNSLGIMELLTPNRRNALSSVFASIYNFALSAKKESSSIPQAANG